MFININFGSSALWLTIRCSQNVDELLVSTQPNFQPTFILGEDVKKSSICFINYIYVYIFMITINFSSAVSRLLIHSWQIHCASILMTLVSPSLAAFGIHE